MTDLGTTSATIDEERPEVAAEARQRSRRGISLEVIGLYVICIAGALALAALLVAATGGSWTAVFSAILDGSILNKGRIGLTLAVSAPNGALAPFGFATYPDGTALITLAHSNQDALFRNGSFTSLIAAGQAASSPASIAGLGGASACVCVGPPLSASGSSSGSLSTTSTALTRPQL